MPKTAQSFDIVVSPNAVELPAASANVLFNQSYVNRQAPLTRLLKPYGRMELRNNGTFQIGRTYGTPLALKPYSACSWVSSGEVEKEVTNVVPVALELKKEECVENFLGGIFTNLVTLQESGASLNSPAYQEVVREVLSAYSDSVHLSTLAQLSGGGMYQNVTTPTFLSGVSAAQQAAWQKANAVTGQPQGVVSGITKTLLNGAGTYANFNVSGGIVAGDIDSTVTTNPIMKPANVLAAMDRVIAGAPMLLRSEVEASYGVIMPNDTMRPFFTVDRYTFSAISTAYNVQGNLSMMQDPPLKMVTNSEFGAMYYTYKRIPIHVDNNLTAFEDGFIKKRTFSITLTVQQNIQFGASFGVPPLSLDRTVSPLRFAFGKDLNNEHLMFIKQALLLATVIMDPNYIASAQYTANIA